MSIECDAPSIAAIDLHTRKLRYFLAVADELHFSRAAARVFLTQQALSRHIKELEDELGFALFDRTTRKVSLTAAGETFYEAARRLIGGFDDAVAASRRVDRALTGSLRLGFTPGAALELTAPILNAYREAYPDVEVQMREFPVGDPSAGMASGVTDVSFVRLPQGTQHIETEPLFVDPLVAVVACGHRLATQTSVGVAELVKEQLTLSVTSDEVYKDFWSLRDAPGGPAHCLAVSSVTEEMALVAAGVAITMTSSAIQSIAPMPGLRYLLVEDWPGSTVALAWHADERSQAVARFVDIACSVRDRESELVEQMQTRRPT